MDVRIDEGRGEQATLCVELAAAVRLQRAGGPDLGNGLTVGSNVDERDGGARGRMDARVADEQSCRGTLPAADSTSRERPPNAIRGQLRCAAMDGGSGLENVLAELREREPIFHRHELGTTRADFDAQTAPDFWEVGASGRVYTREVVWDTLAERYADPGYAAADDWWTSDFVCREIAPATYLLTYVLRQGDRVTRRLTVWQGATGRWRILYHQGTVVGEP